VFAKMDIMKALIYATSVIRSAKHVLILAPAQVVIQIYFGRGYRIFKRVALA